MVRSGASKFAARFQLRAAPPFSWKTSCRKADKQLGNEHVFQIARGIKTTRVRGPPPFEYEQIGAESVEFGGACGDLWSLKRQVGVDPRRKLVCRCCCQS